MHYPQSHQDTETEIIGHFSPAEVMELIEMQGGMPDPHPSGLPYFKKLEDRFFEPEIRKGIQNWAREGFAGGGEVGGINDFLRENGRFGDTIPVVLPRRVADLFDYALFGGVGKNPGNPATGKREYWLGGLIGGLKNIFNTVGSGVKSVANPVSHFFSNTLMPALQKAGQIAAPIAGQALQAATPALTSAIQNSVTNMGGGGDLANLAGQIAGGATNNFANTASTAFNQGQGFNPVNAAQSALQSGAINTIPSATNIAAKNLANAGSGYGAGSLPEILSGMGSEFLSNLGPAIAAGMA